MMKMTMSISEARKRLPQIMKSLRASRDAVYQITVHGEVIAEITSPPMVKPGEAAARLLSLRRTRSLKEARGRKTKVSEHVKEYLYGAEAER
jgi:antitoxin (DNA-binding transcriptional repressor) of toxin-antitoxin stability system